MHGVVREHLRIGRVVHLAEDRKRPPARGADAAAAGGRLALEHVLAHELAKVEVRDVHGAEPQIDAREDVARVVAHDAGRPARAPETFGERVEVARAPLHRGNIDRDAVVVRMPARGRPRDP